MKPSQIDRRRVYIGPDGSSRKVLEVAGYPHRVKWKRLQSLGGPAGGCKQGSCSLSSFAGWASREHPDDRLYIPFLASGATYTYRGHDVTMHLRRAENGLVSWTWTREDGVTGTTSEPYLLSHILYCVSRQ